MKTKKWKKSKLQKKVQDESVTSWMKYWSVSLDLVHPGRLLAAFLAHQGVCMGREPIHIDAGLQVSLRVDKGNEHSQNYH